MFRGIKALLAGVIAGTALGVLFSPQSGESIRKKFKKEIDEGGTGLDTVKNTLGAMGHELGETAKEAFDEFKQTEVYKDGSAKFKAEVEKAKKEAMKAKGAAEKEARKVVKKAKSTVKKKTAQAKKTVKKATVKAKKTVKKATTKAKKAVKKVSKKK